MTDKAWKADERKVADVLGGKRIPLSGASEISSKCDVDCSWLLVEVKRRARFSAVRWLDKICESARAEGCIGAVAVHVSGSRDWIIILRLDDFAGLKKRLEAGGSIADRH